MRADTVQSNADGMDPYAYVGDNPESKTDPTGHDSGVLGDPVSQAFVEAWYISLEIGSDVLVDQPANIHNVDMAIKNAALPNWDGSRAGLDKLIQNLGSTTDGGERGYGFPDIMNLDDHLIYEVKGGNLQPDGGTNFPSPYTIAYGYAQARWYAAMANRDPFWQTFGTWSAGSLALDPKLQAAFAACGGLSCIEQMPDGRWIMITYSQGGVLSYVAYPAAKKPQPFVAPKIYYSLYARYESALTGIAVAAFAGAAAGGAAWGKAAFPSGNGATLGCSFTATTVVEIPGGEKLIGEIVIGDEVLAYDVNTRKVDVQTVEHVWTHDDNDLVDVTISFVTGHKSEQELVHTTSRHPFLTKERGFIPVAQLKAGMHVLQANGNVGIITHIEPLSGMMVMYNLEVTKDHTFMVGEGQWIVHNACLPINF